MSRNYTCEQFAAANDRGTTWTPAEADAKAEAKELRDALTSLEREVAREIPEAPPTEWPEGFTWALTQDTDGYPLAVSRAAWEKYPIPCKGGLTEDQLAAHRSAGWSVQK